MDDPRYQRATGACQDRSKPGLGRHHIVQHFVFGVSNDEMFQFAPTGPSIFRSQSQCYLCILLPSCEAFMSMTGITLDVEYPR